MKIKIQLATTVEGLVDIYAGYHIVEIDKTWPQIKNAINHGREIRSSNFLDVTRDNGEPMLINVDQIAYIMPAPGTPE